MNDPEPNVEPAADPAPPPPEPVADPPPAEPAPEPKAKAKEPEPKEPEPAPYWPEDWREKHAEHISAGDKKAYKKELKRLERFTDPTGIYAMAREAEAKLHEGGLVKIPGKDAKEEDVSAFHKALGVPEKSEDYFKDIQLENGAVIGELDKPVADSFAEAVHEVGATPAFVNKALNWYFDLQEQQAAALDAEDDKFSRESKQELREEMGPAFQRNTNSVGSLFATAAGGADLDNEGSLYARLMGGRMSDGKVIGDDPDMVRFMVSMARELNPTITVVDGGDQSGQSIDAEIANIEKRMREDKRGYFKDETMQARHRDLLDAQARNRERKRA